MISCILPAALILLAWYFVARNSPRGYEDRFGFHRGNPPAEDPRD